MGFYKVLGSLMFMSLMFINYMGAAGDDPGDKVFSFQAINVSQDLEGL